MPHDTHVHNRASVSVHTCTGRLSRARRRAAAAKSPRACMAREARRLAPFTRVGKLSRDIDTQPSCRCVPGGRHRSAQSVRVPSQGRDPEGTAPESASGTVAPESALPAWKVLRGRSHHALVRSTPGVAPMHGCDVGPSLREANVHEQKARGGVCTGKRRWLGGTGKHPPARRALIGRSHLVLARSKPGVAPMRVECTHECGHEKQEPARAVYKHMRHAVAHFGVGAS